MEFFSFARLENNFLLAQPQMTPDETAFRLFSSFVVCFLNCFQEDGDPPVNESLSIENTLWATTVVASGKYVTAGTLQAMRDTIFKNSPELFLQGRAGCSQALLPITTVERCYCAFLTHLNILLKGR